MVRLRVTESARERKIPCLVAKETPRHHFPMRENTFSVLSTTTSE
jgi:hypothetical protein